MRHQVSNLAIRRRRHRRRRPFRPLKHHAKQDPRNVKMIWKCLLSLPPPRYHSTSLVVGPSAPGTSGALLSCSLPWAAPSGTWPFSYILGRVLLSLPLMIE